ncbi:MAG: hypothetical protein VKJ31_03570 [Synechococcus sp.]|nr:hypothetical protein [Synechococcus sp.]
MGTKESLTTTASSMGRFRLSADQSNHAGEPLTGSTLTINPVVNINGSDSLEYSWQYLSRTQSKALNAFELAREEVALNFNISGDAITGTVMMGTLFDQAVHTNDLYSNKINIFDTAHGVLFEPSTIGGALNRVLASENNAPYYLPTYKTIAAARGLPASSGTAMHMELGGFELYLSEAGEPIELLSFDSAGNLTGSEELTGAALLNAERELKINLDDSVDFYGATINSKAFNKDLITPSSSQRVNAYTSSIGLILSGQQLSENSTVESNAIPTPNDIILLSSNNAGHNLASNQTIRDARWSFDSSNAKIYELYLEGPSNSFEKAVFNNKGALQSSESLSNTALLHAELELQLDLDGDGTTAGRSSGTALLNKNSQTPPHAFTGALNAYTFGNESLGNGIVLSSEQLNQGEEIGKRTISHSQQLITLSDHNKNYELPGDKEVAAARTLFSNALDPANPAEKQVDGYELYLRSTSDDSISKATFNADGGLTSTTPLADAALIHAELELKLDLDNNGVIAAKVANEILNKNNQPAPYPTAETLNVYTSSIDNGLILSTNRLNPDDNIGALGTSTTEQLINLSANNQGFILPDQATIKLARTQFANGSGAPADTSVEGYELFVTTTPNSIERFSFDANGIFTGSELLKGPELINTERELRFDLNNDGITSIQIGEQLLNKTIPPHTYTGALNVYNSESGIILTSSTTLTDTAHSWSNSADQLVVVSKDGKGFQLPKFSSIKAARALYADGTTTPSPSTPAIGYELFLEDWQGAINKYSLNADGEVLIEEEWKAINTTDAVDGDHTYTLTDADLGHKIRGIITSTGGSGDELIETTNPLDRVSFQLALNGYANIGELIEIDASSIPANTEVLDAGFEQQWPAGTHVLRLDDFTWKYSDGNYVISYRGEELQQAINGGMQGSNWYPSHEYTNPASITLKLASEEITIQLETYNFTPGDQTGGFDKMNLGTEIDPLSVANHQAIYVEPNIIIRPEPLAKPLPLVFKENPSIAIETTGFLALPFSGSDPREIKTFERNSNLRAFIEVLDPNNDSLLVRSEPVTIGGILTDTGSSGSGKHPPAIYTPNNEPQGRLKLIGTAKKGESIHLDDSSISDEDAITTPLTYSWQVFNSSTQRWDQLGTNDAKDENLTLTSALVGSQMRGHATYTDGNGREEVVVSDSFFVQPGPETQKISTARQSIPYLPGSPISIPLQYNTTTNNSSLHGLTINLHYDSKVLTPAGDAASNHGVNDLTFNSISSTGNKAIVFAVSQEADESNSDLDSNTDAKLILSWFSSDAEFSGSELPKSLANLLFNTTSGATVDSITGSTINVTSSPFDRPQNTSFSADPIHLMPTPFSLDVDGDGKASLYTDGIMIIRRLIGLETCTTGFGKEFFNANNRHSAEQVDALLDQAYETGKFDIDRSGNTSLYTDGIMLIRYLISPGLIDQSNELIADNSEFKDNTTQLKDALNTLNPSLGS